jgi:hypothetical protein
VDAAHQPYSEGSFAATPCSRTVKLKPPYLKHALTTKTRRFCAIRNKIISLRRREAHRLIA